MCFLLNVNIVLIAFFLLYNFASNICVSIVYFCFSANQKVIQQSQQRPASTPTESQHCVLTSVQQEIAARRKANISRQDSRLSVKCLIESIENATKQAKAGIM